MTSNFHIGLPEKNDSVKRSTHSNIFGDDPVEQTQKKNAQASSIKNILMEETDNAKEKNTNGVHAKKTPDENDVVSNENINTANPEAPVRVRMPPGGFSSGLW